MNPKEKEELAKKGIIRDAGVTLEIDPNKESIRKILEDIRTDLHELLLITEGRQK